ncbi:hypothetical protein FQN57_007312 [Myotisia sp. PD_48]|nr:hypothetical protein FQN57_007312 [Myotisia sp. PD_48]
MSVENNPIAKGNINSKAVLITIWVLFGVTLGLLIARLAIRLRVHLRLFWDDIFASLGFAFLLIQNVLIIFILPRVFMVAHYLAGNIDRPANFDSQIAVMLKLSLAINIMFATSIYLVKASVLALLWRIVENLANFRRSWWAVMILVILSYLVSVALEPIACAKLYNNGCVSASDISRNLIALRIGTALDVITDAFIMAIPVALTVKSKLPRAQKLGLVGLFGLGFTIIAMAIVRIISLNEHDRHPSLSWKVFWGSLESSVAVMTSCCASFKTLFTLHRRTSGYPFASERDKYFSSNGRQRPQGYSTETSQGITNRIAVSPQHMNNSTYGSSEMDFPLVSTPSHTER